MRLCALKGPCVDPPAVNKVPFLGWNIRVQSARMKLKMIKLSSAKVGVNVGIIHSCIGMDDREYDCHHPLKSGSIPRVK